MKDNLGNNELPKYIKSLPIFVLIVCLTMTAIVWWIWGKFDLERQQDRFSRDCNRIDRAIKDRLHEYEIVLTGGAGLFIASDNVSRKEWRAYVEYMHVQKLFPGIQGMGFSPVIKPSELAVHIRRIRSEGFPNYTVRPEGKRDVYTSIIFLEPFDKRNQRAFGYDMFSEPVRRAAMERARDTASASISGKVILVQETEKEIQPGFLMYIPLYRKGMPISNTEERRAALIGYVYSPFRMNDLLSGIFPVRDNILEYKIFDGSNVSQASLIYDSDVAGNSIQGNKQPKFSGQRTVGLYGHQWTMYYYTGHNFDPTSDQIMSKTVLLTGIIISILTFLLVKVLVDTRLQAEAELRRLKLQSELIINSVGEGIYGMAPDGKMTFVNPEAARLFGYNKEELIDQYIHPLIHHTRADGTPYPQEECRALIAFKEGTARTVSDEVFWRKDGTSFPVEYTSTPVLDQHDRPTGAVVVFRDITERNEIEKERIARIAAEEANRAKSDFLANMSHELRTPLNGIIGFADLLHGGIAGVVNSEQKEYAGLIHHSGKHLLSLINDILDMTKVEAGKMEIELSRLMLIFEIENAVLLVKEKALKHGIAITVDLQSDLEIEADERKLRQVLFNLLSNAVKFTPDGGSVLVAAQLISGNELNSIMSREEGRAVAVAGESCMISVTDTGIGIKEEDMSKLFREFSQIGNVHTKEYEGTGLGLALTKKLVELHGGCIWVESIFGQGSTFSFAIPLRDSLDLPAKRDPREYDKISNASETTAISLNMLLAEDNIINQELVKTLLSKRGHSISIVQDGMEVLDALRRDRFDLIFMDIQMPKQDGYETTRLIRESEGEKFDKHIPIIAMTAYAMRGDREKCLQAGMNDYISKPIAVEELDRVLNNYISKKQVIS